MSLTNRKDITCCLPADIAKIIESIGLKSIEEIRVRQGMPLSVILGGESFFLGTDGITADLKKAYYVSKEDIQHCVVKITKGSYYSFEDEIKNGYVTINGGHRVGIGGRGVSEGNKLVSISEISSLNFRVAKQVKNCADEAFMFIKQRQKIFNTVIISPPGCGKTTVLRELARKLSEAEVKVCVVDERDELCGVYDGNCSYEIGTSTDIYSGIKKSEAIPMAVRCLSPKVIICDELGGKEDFESAFYASSCGVAVISSMHGLRAEDVLKRCDKEKFLSCFESYIILDYDKRIKMKGKTEELLCLKRQE